MCFFTKPLRNSNLKLTVRLSKIEKRATVWWALYRYFPALKGAIGPDSVNKPENAMTMRSDIHGLFAKYRFAFKPAISQVS